MTVGWDGQPKTGEQVSERKIPRELSDRVRQRIENYLTNMHRPALRRDIRPVIDSIEKQYRATGWLSYRQVETLRRCCIASHIGHPVGGGGGGPCFGRNAPAGRGRGPVG